MWADGAGKTLEYFIRLFVFPRHLQWVEYHLVISMISESNECYALVWFWKSESASKAFSFIFQSPLRLRNISFFNLSMVNYLIPSVFFNWDKFNKLIVVQRGPFSYRQRYPSSQRSKCCGLERCSRVVHNKSSVMKNIVFDKSADHAKPLSSCLST